MKSTEYRKENILKRFLAELSRIWKGLVFRYKQFLCFFVAMFVCQSFCFLLLFSNGTNNENVRKTVISRYDYHIAVESLSQAQSVYLVNSIYEANSTEVLYTCKSEEKDGSYTVYIRLGEAGLPTKETERLYNAFVESVLPRAGLSLPTEESETVGTYTVSLSPLYTCYDDYIRENNILSVVIAVPLAAVSILLLMFLYSIRLKDQKLLFGIYMSFGADFKKLFETAVKEMLLLSAVSLVPSFLFSIGAAALIYLPHGIMPVLPLGQFGLFLVFNFIVVYLSVYIPTKRLSLKTPLSLISVQDNSDSVTSPRRSFRLFGKHFPRDYELFGLLRFRTHYVRLVLTATLFVACFLSGVGLSIMYKTAGTGAIETHVITVPRDISAEEGLQDCDDFVASLCELRGVDYAFWEEATSATSLRAFMMMQTKSARGANEYVVRTDSVVNTEENTKAKYEAYVDAGYTAATSTFTYTLYDKAMIDLLTETYDVDGNPYAILNGTGQIIVSESLFNRDVFDFSPGDTVLLCECVSGQLPDNILYTDEQSVLREQLKISGIRFRSYTICAVVRDMQSTNRFTVGVNASDYETLTDEMALPERVSVYLEYGLSLDEVDRISEEITSVMQIYTDAGYTLKETGNYLEAKLTEEKYSGIRTVLWSILILTLSPLVWFYSQVLFYSKREKEFWILRAFGAYEEDIRGIHLWGGLITAASAVLVAVLEGLLCHYLLYAFCNYFLSALGIVSGVRYTFSVSILALLCALLVTAAFGFLSAYLPYFRRRTGSAPRNETTIPEKRKRME